MPDDRSPVVSVCIQTYQHAAFIAQCIESVLQQQTDFSFEIIIGEDDSTDGTRDICIRYSQKYPGIIRLFLRSEKDKIYINGEKTGRYNMINNLKAARGKYIALLDGDDYWPDPHKMQKQVDHLAANPGYSICYCDFYTLKNDKLYRHSSLKKKLFQPKPADLAHHCFIQPCTCMFRNPGFDSIPDHYWKLPVLDYCLFLEAAGRGKIFYIKKYMAVYRHHPTGFWIGAGKEKNLIRLLNFLDIMIPHSQGIIQKKLKQQRIRRIKQLMRWYIRTKQHEKLYSLKEKLEMPSSAVKIKNINGYIRLNQIRYAFKKIITLKKGRRTE